jgi:hypothetical protein
MTPQLVLIFVALAAGACFVLGLGLQVRGGFRQRPSLLGARLLLTGAGIVPLGIAVFAVMIGLRDGYVPFLLAAIPAGVIGIIALLAARSLRFGRRGPNG